MTSPLRARPRFGVRTALIVVAVLPLSAVGLLSASSVAESTREASAATEVGVLSEEVRSLVSVQSALAVETYWGSATAAVGSFGLTPDMIEEIIGLDLDDKLAQARDGVDRAIGEVDAEELRQSILAARATTRSTGTSTPAVSGAYLESKRLTGERVRSSLRRLARGAGEVTDPTETIESVRVLEATVEMQTHLTSLATNLFGARFPEQASTDPRMRLVAAQAQYETALAELTSLLPERSELGLILRSTTTDSRTTEFMSAVTAAAERVSDGLPVSGAPAVDIDAEASAFTNSLAVIEEYGVLVDSAAARLDVVSNRLERAAKSRQQFEVAAVLGTVVASMLAIALMSRWIVTPLRNVSVTAIAMTAGNLEARARVSGPREVRTAAGALNDAARTLQSAEQQALALAEDDLDSPVLSEPVPGRLGQSFRAALTRLATEISEREELRHRLQHEATHDGLTELPNRTAIVDGLGHAMTRARHTSNLVAVLFIDLDGFKHINDHNGHATGDLVLRTIAQRITASTRDSDLVGRLGGDEFVVIAEPVADIAEAVELARRIRSAITQPISTKASSVTPGASIGVAIAGAEDLTPHEVLRDADLAVYRAKELGGGEIEVCDLQLRDEVAHRYDVEERLAAAIAHGDLVLDYQPVVDARDHSLVGVEALVRWPQPDGTMAQPDDFIPIAECSNLIVELDRWVLTAAVEQLATWTDHPLLGGMTVAVNTSARHISTTPFAHHVVETLQSRGVDPRRIVIEVTESALLADLDHVVDQLEHFRSHGIQVAIDDFGTGYTSLALLTQLPLDMLKLDRSLVPCLDIPRDAAIVELIIETAHLLGLTITAEGVETPDQAARLQMLGVDHFQGYHFGRPVRPAALEADRADRLSSLG